VLEVGRHCTVLDIRKAFKKLSKVYHPDKNTDISAEKKFQDIKAAYEVTYH
jgi:molecular chaperone DnaJ